MSRRTILHVVPHTHWDREWYEPFEAYRFRLVKVVDRLLEVLDDDPAFRHFNFDGQTAAIEDYLEVRPPVGPEVERFIREGRLAIGPWRILMDEFLCSPETIIRNIQQGTARATAMGGSMPLGYIPDSFGHVAQMPQLLRLAGLSDACVWRGVPFAVDRTAFVWEAPDGSAVRTLYLATSYSNGASLPTAFEDLIVRAKRIVEDLAPFSPGDVLLVMNGTDHRGPEEHLPALFARANTQQDSYEFRLGSLSEYLRDAPADRLPHWKGELRSGARANLLMGVASARMPLKQAEMRASIALERYAEPLSAIAGTDTGRLLERAWRQMVENSAHDSICGCGVDAVADQVLARYVEAARVAELVARDAAEALAGRVDATAVPEGAEGVVLVNPSPRARGGVHEVTVSVDDPDAISFAAPDGTVCAAQLTAQPLRQVIVDLTIKGTELARIVPTIHGRMMGALTVNRLEIEEGRRTTVRLHLGAVAEGHFDVEAAKRRVEEIIARKPHAKYHVIGEGPPLCHLLVEAPVTGGLGWTVLTPRDGAAKPKDPVSLHDRTITNGTLDATVHADGSVSLLHLPSGRRLDRVLVLEDEGDAGDEYNFSPTERGAVVTMPSEVSVSPGARGPLEASLIVRRRYRVPAELTASGRARSRRTVPLDTTTTVALRSGEPFLRVTIHVENRASDHRLRVIVPVPANAVTTHAESAFAVVERSRTAESGSHEHPLPTYPCRRFVDASDGASGVAVLHAGTPEYELTERGLAVTLLRCVGWLSRQGTLYRAGPAGPPLETPGAQATGTHRFELAVYPHEGGWREGRVYEMSEAFTLPFRPAVVRAHPGSLPREGTGLRIEPESVQLSALIRDQDRIDVRVYNASPDSVEAHLTAGPTLPFTEAATVDLHGSASSACRVEGGSVVLPLRGWEIATVRLRPRAT